MMNDSKFVACVRGNPSRKDIIPVLMILCLVVLFSWRSTWNKSNTGDELVHVLSGHAAWSQNDYRFNPENGTIPGRIAALPFQFMDEGLSLDIESSGWAKSDQWHLGHQLWFESPIDHREILKLSHMSMLLFNLIGIALVFIWSGSLWGRGGAYLSLLLAGFSPNFLGHMPLATSDFFGAWTLVLAVLAYARLLECITPGRVLAAGLSAGLAILCKHTAVLLAPIGIILLIWRICDGQTLRIHTWNTRKCMDSFRYKLLSLTGATLAAIIPCYLLIWLVFGFRYSASNPASGSFESFQVDWISLSPTVVDPFIGIIRKWHMLPESFLYGLNFILSSSARGSFLNGVFSSEGFPFYHFWTFLYKTPLQAIALHALGWGSLAIYLWKHKSENIPSSIRGILALALIYGLLLLTSDISIGHRHAFVLLYLSCIVSGICVRRSIGNNRLLAYGALLLALSMIPLSWMNIDQTISYMNPIGGGINGGYKRLNDSSLDWGQDLPSAVQAIQRYQVNHLDDEVYFSYFGSADPAAFGLRDVNMLYAWGIWEILERPDYIPHFEPGLYVISASEMDSMPDDWTLKLEIRYRMLQNSSNLIYDKLLAENTLASARANTILTREEIKTLDDYELFRVQRLKMNLTQREPDEILHGSILLFGLSKDDLLAIDGGNNSN